MSRLSETIASIFTGSTWGHWIHFPASANSATDISGGGRNLSSTGSATPTLADGPVGRSISYNGSTQRHASATGNPLTPLPADWTIWCLLKGTPAAGIACITLGADGGAYVAIMAAASSRTGVKIRSDNATITLDSTFSANAFDGNWHDLAIVSSGRSVTLYLDGQPIALASGSAAWSNLAHTIPALSLGFGPGGYAAVSVQNLVISSRAITPAQAEQLHDAVPLARIKPAGGGDYTTLAAWEDSIDGVSFPSETLLAECHSGNAGYVHMDPVTNLRIYAAAGAEHKGDRTTPTAAATNNLGITPAAAGLSITVEGLVIKLAFVSLQNAAGCNVSLRQCILRAIGEEVLFSSNFLYSGTIELQNCVLMGDVAFYSLDGYAAEGVTGHLKLHNCTIDVISMDDNYFYGEGAVHIEAVNTVSTAGPLNNATAGVMNLVSCAWNASAAAWFVNPGVDYRLKAGSPGIGAGADLSGLYATDLAGVPRPLGGAWDIGAFEFVPPLDRRRRGFEALIW